MARGFIILFFILARATLFAQSGSPAPVLSPAPTVQELRAAFEGVQRGDYDLFSVLALITERGDVTIDSLQTLIDQGTAAPDSSRRTSLCSIVALDALGSQHSVVTLMGIATSFHDVEIRGSALTVLARNQHDRAIADTSVPEKNIVLLFLQALEDTAVIPSMNLSVSGIANEGLRNWLGSDQHANGPDSVRVKVGSQLVGMSRAEYRRHWWQTNSDRLIWNRDEGIFRIPRVP